MKYLIFILVLILKLSGHLAGQVFPHQLKAGSQGDVIATDIDGKNRLQKLSVPDYASLSSLSGAIKAVQVTNEGIAGTFIYDPTATTTDGGIVPVSGWVRQFEGNINVTWFGAIANDLISDQSAFEDAISYVNNASSTDLQRGILIPEGTFRIDSIDLTNFIGQYFHGSGRRKTNIRFLSNVPKGLILNRGVNGDGGQMSNVSIGGFTLDANGVPGMTDVVYSDSFTRGNISDITIYGGINSFRFGYGWLCEMSSITAINYSGTGFVFEGASNNGLTAYNLSASTTNGAATNYLIATNSLTLINLASEGSPLKGVVIDGESRSVNFVGGHSEGANTGIEINGNVSLATSIRVNGFFFYNTDNPLTMNSTVRNISFTDNVITPIDPSKVDIELNAESFTAYGNVIQGATYIDEINAYDVTNFNTVSVVRVERANFGLSFNKKKLYYERSSGTNNTTITDINTIVDIEPGGSGEIEFVQRLSGTTTTSQIIRFEVTDSGVLSWANVYQIGLNLIKDVNYNSSTKRIQIANVYGGNNSLVLKYNRDA